MNLHNDRWTRVARIYPRADFLTIQVINAPCGRLVLSQDVSWEDFRTQVQQLLEEQFGPGVIFLGAFSARYDKHIGDDQEWLLFQYFLAHSDSNRIIDLECHFIVSRPGRIRIDISGLNGHLGSVEVPDNIDWLQFRNILEDQFGRGRLLLGVSDINSRRISNQHDWQQLLDHPPLLWRLSCIWGNTDSHRESVYRGAEIYREATQLEEDLRYGNPRKATSDFLAASWRTRNDQVLTALFLQKYEQILRDCQTPTNAAELYRRLSGLTNQDLEHRMKMALAELAFQKSEGRSFLDSPAEFQGSVSVEDLWSLLHRNVVTYDQLTRNLRLKLDNPERLSEYLSEHIDMVRYVPHSLLIRHRLFLRQMVTQRPWLYWQLPSPLRADLLSVLTEALNKREGDSPSKFLSDSDDGSDYSSEESTKERPQKRPRRSVVKSRQSKKKDT